MRSKHPDFSYHQWAVSMNPDQSVHEIPLRKQEKKTNTKSQKSPNLTKMLITVHENPYAKVTKTIEVFQEN